MPERFNKTADTAIKWCIYAIVFAAPFSKSISEIAITLAIIMWILRKVVNKDYRIVKTGLNLPLLLLVITAAISIFNSDFMGLSVRAFFTKMLKFVALYFVIVENIDSKSKLKDLFIVAFLSMSIIMFDGFVQYFSGLDFLHLPPYPSYKARLASDCGGFFRGFPTASFPFPNDFAAWMLLALLPLVCVTIFDLRRKDVRFFTGLISLGLFGLFFLTKTRSAWLGMGLSTLYIAISRGKMWLIVFLILIVALPFALKMEMAQYIFSFGSIGDRMGMWDTAWSIFKNHPATGSGLNTFFVNFKRYRNDEFRDRKGSYAHNCYLQMACDTGLAGLAAFLWLVCSYFLSVKKGLKIIEDKFHYSILWGMSIGVFAFLIHSFFDTNLYSLNLATLFWTAIGVSQCTIKIFEADSHG